MKKYKDIGIYDFSDYAEEITGEDLIKINGGSSSCNGSGPGNGGSSAASGGSGSKGSGSPSMGPSSGSCGGGGSPSVPSGSGGNSGSGFSTSGSGSGSAPSSGTGSCGGSISSGTPSGYNPGANGVNDDYGELPEANPYAYAAYMAKQGQAKEEGDPERYKGYNVYGTGRKDEYSLPGEDIRTYVLVIRQNDGLGNSFDSDRYVYKNGKMVFHDKVGANCRPEYLDEENFTEPDGVYYFTTAGLIKNTDGTFDSNSYHNVLIHQTNDPNIPKEIRDKINIAPRNFLEHCNQYKISADLKEKSGTIYGNNLYPYSAGCTIGKDGQEHHDLYMSVLLNGVSNVENIRKEIRSISNIGK